MIKPSWPTNILCPECNHASQSFARSFWQHLPSSKYLLLNMLGMIPVALLSELALAHCHENVPCPNRNIWTVWRGSNFCIEVASGRLRFGASYRPVWVSLTFPMTRADKSENCDIMFLFRLPFLTTLSFKYSIRILEFELTNRQITRRTKGVHRSSISITSE